MLIQSVHGRQIIDSRGNPTVEADVILEDGSLGRASSPSGASTGTNEALELRDGDKTKYNGRGVEKAVFNINTFIAKAIIGMDAALQGAADSAMIKLDGTENKSTLGANAMLAVSLAVAKAAAISKKIPLYEHIGALAGNKNFILPMPMVNILNGGAHTNWQTTQIQEFMIMPVGARTFSDAVRMCSEVFHALGKILEENNLATSLGDEGGYAPKVKNDEEAIEYIRSASVKAGYEFGKDIKIALDVAASELEGKLPDYKSLVDKYGVASIEDAHAEDDWQAWKNLTAEVGSKVQLVGDDLFVTNTKFLAKGITEKAGNAILIKLNQIGTLTETIDAVRMAKDGGFKSVISHRSGETEDTTIAHLAVGLGTGQIKTGSMARGERTAKYNELLRIEEALGKDKFAKYE